MHVGGVLHGGAIMSLADSGGGLCAFLNLPEDAKGTATIESKTNFFGAVRDGHVTATSRPLTRARRRSSSRRTSTTPAAATSPASPRRRPCFDSCLRGEGREGGGGGEGGEGGGGGGEGLARYSPC